ncbi:MAG: DNA repair protein RadA [Nitrospinota bacterium]
MKKARSVYVCQSCGSRHLKWIGKCPDCGEWNTLVEELIVKPSSRRSGSMTGAALSESKPRPLFELSVKDGGRTSTGMAEMDRVLGGGIVDGSLVLIGGDPGIGKSTLVLQLCGKIADGRSVLYVSGEESARQIKMRADRLGINSPSLLILTETNVEHIAAQVDAIKPALVVIDSIQTVFTDELGAAPGSVGQLRESTARLMQTCKSLNVPFFLVGHVTKDGAIAGPRVLEHMVDTVLYFEGDRDHYFRVLRSVKNRFGSTHEIGVFEMGESGLAEVKNPSEYLVSGRTEPVSGSVIACTLSGTRPILVELQALVTPTNFGNPRRTAVGFDYNRIVLLSAILQKRAGLMLDSEDIYVSASGGVRVDDPGSDLALAAAITGSFRNIAARADTLFVGEVGLGGELRHVSSMNLRLKEAARMGMKRAIVPQISAKDKSNENYGKIEVATIDHVSSLAEFMQS